MKRALLIAGGLMLVSAPLHAYVSGGTMMGRNLNHRHQQSSTQTTSTETTDPATDPLATDPTVGMIDVREGREISESEPGHPVPEPGTMAIGSMGLLAAAAFMKKRRSKSN